MWGADGRSLIAVKDRGLANIDIDTGAVTELVSSADSTRCLAAERPMRPPEE